MITRKDPTCLRCRGVSAVPVVKNICSNNQFLQIQTTVCLRLFRVQDRSWRTAARWNNNNSTRAEIKPHNSLASSSSSTTIMILRDVVNKLCLETQIPSQICFFPWTAEVQLRAAQLLFYVWCVTSDIKRFYSVSSPAGLRLLLSCQALACLLSTRPGVGAVKVSRLFITGGVQCADDGRIIGIHDFWCSMSKYSH